jgi:enoyl-CoA hydratase/carnithine racemase
MSDTWINPAAATESPEYFSRYPRVAMSRTGDGVLTVRLHLDEGPITFSLPTYQQLVQAFTDIGADPQNRVVVLTGTGDAFIGGADLGDPTESFTPEGFDAYYWHGSRLSQRLLDIQAPIVCAMNGRAVIHTEMPLLCDVLIAADDAYFEDTGHLPGGIVAGDGVQTVWEAVLGPMQMRHFIWLRQKITAARLHELGVVAELHPRAAVLERAQAIAAELAKQPTLNLRYTALALKHRFKQLFAEQVPLGMALEGITINQALRQMQAQGS